MFGGGTNCNAVEFGFDMAMDFFQSSLSGWSLADSGTKIIWEVVYWAHSAIRIRTRIYAH